MRECRGAELYYPSGEFYYWPSFLGGEEASRLFHTLLSKCAWERRKATFGHAVPRAEAYYGDPGTHYTYSRREYNPLPWLPELLSLKARVEEATPLAAYGSLPKTGYNAVLCNQYRDGNDSVGLHADNEPEMGPVIASISLGAERLFRLKRNGGAVVFSERLPDGSLLVMTGETQKNFKHEVPKELRVTEPRINLTFRWIERNRVGLCLDCRYMRRIKSDGGSTFCFCERSITDPSFPKYPRLPVVQCSGHVPNSESSR